MLEPHVEYVPVCPEVEIGLGVPRDPIRIERAPKDDEVGGLRLVQPSTGRDLTESMVAFGHQFADSTAQVDGLLLKNRSPSCGIGDVKVYVGEVPATGKGQGMFAAVMAERYPTAPMEDEGRLTNAEIRHHWLTRLYAMARLREAAEAGPAGLVDFHTRYKLVLMAHSPRGQRELGRLVADAGAVGAFVERVDRYRAGLADALAEPAGRGAMINAVQHAQGHFKRALEAAEKRQFQMLQTEYREGRLPFQALLAVLGSWVERFDEPYLREQWFFRPYPKDLVLAADSGRGRLA
jgi:uncharacterized protein YbgA (DUF1722 family)/uncharacterized protein YbbK (DUF523 family)